MLPETMKMNFFGEGTIEVSSMSVFYATLVGLIVGGVISSVTEYYTGLGKKPILKIVQQSDTGSTNIISGLASYWYDFYFPFYSIVQGALFGDLTNLDSMV